MIKKFFLILMAILILYMPLDIKSVNAAIPDDEIPFTFEENSKYNKPKLTLVPKKEPPRPPITNPTTKIPGAIGLIVSLASLTPYGQAIIKSGEDKLTQFDMWLYDNIPHEEILNGIHDGFLNVTDSISDFISDLINQNKIYENLLEYPDYGFDYLFVDLSYYDDYAEFIVGPTAFVESSGLFAFVRTYSYNSYPDSNNLNVYRARSDYIGSNNKRFRVDATSLIENDARNLASSVTGLLTYGNSYNFTYISPQRFFDELPHLKDRLINDNLSNLDNPFFINNENHDINIINKIPLIPDHFPDLNNNHLPDLNKNVEVKDISIVEIDGEKFYEINIQNPYHNPNRPTLPNINPEELPYYAPIHTPDDNDPIWEPEFVPTPNPNFDPTTHPNYDPDSNPDPEPDPDPDPEIDESLSIIEKIWEWLKSFFSKLANLLAPIIALLQQILNFLNNLLQSLGNLLSDLLAPIINLLNMINNLFTNLINSLQDMLINLFVPAPNFMSNQIEPLKNTFQSKFSDMFLIPSIFDDMNDQCTALEDIEINIMGQNATIVKFDYLNNASNWFKPVMAAFIWLLVVIYAYRKIPAILQGRDGVQ